MVERQGSEPTENRVEVSASAGSLQPVGGEPEQLCCEGEGASERPPVKETRASRPRCPYCHDDLQSDSKVSTCEICGTRHHTECFGGGCVVFGCDGAPNAMPELTPFRVAVWALVLFSTVSMSVLVAGLVFEGPYVVVGRVVSGLVVALGVSWALRKLDRANAAARLDMPSRRTQREGRTHTEEALDIITLGGIGGGSGAEAALAELAANAIPKPDVPAGAEFPDACPACGVATEPPEGKEEPDWFCYHCGEQLVPSGEEPE